MYTLIEVVYVKTKVYTSTYTHRDICSSKTYQYFLTKKHNFYVGLNVIQLLISYAMIS